MSRLFVVVVIVALVLTGCAHSQQSSREEIRKAREMWREGEAWRRTQADFPAMTRQDRIDYARLMAPPTPGYEKDYERGLALLAVFKITGSEWAYWEALGWMTTWLVDQERR